MDLYNPVNEFLAERNIDFLKFQEDIADCISGSSLVVDKESILDMSRSMYEYSVREKLIVRNEKESDQIKSWANDLEVILKEYTREKFPHFK